MDALSCFKHDDLEYPRPQALSPALSMLHAFHHAILIKLGIGPGDDANNTLFRPLPMVKAMISYTVRAFFLLVNLH